MTRRHAAALGLAAAVLLAIPGCNDNAFLTEQPLDFIGPTNFYRNQADALAAVNSVYATFINTTGDNYYGRNFYMIVEYPTETATSGRLGGTNERSLPDNYAMAPSHAYLLSVWSSAYQAINRANAVIDRVPAIQMDTVLRARIVGEAKFLRALHYFNLVRLWGGVPLRLHEVTSIDDLDIVRSPAADVYAQIVQDLQDAIAALPPKSGYTAADRGRATRGAAKTLLGKVYLQRGATGVGSAADFASAEGMFRQVVDSAEYSLDPDYLHLFDLYGGNLNEDSPEIIFAIENVRQPGLGGRMSSHMAPNKSQPWLGSSANGSVGVEYSFFLEYDSTATVVDARREGTFLLSWDKGGTMVRYDASLTNKQNEADYMADVPFPRKYLDQLSTGGGAEEPNYILLRYADVLLSLAEAINEQAGPTAEARGFVDQVRARANLPPLPDSLASDKQTFKNSIFLERRKEFVMEGHGHFDSQRNWPWARHRIWLNLLAGRQSGQGNRYPRNNANSPQTEEEMDKYLLFPIPQRAIDINPNLTQNPGW